MPADRFLHARAGKSVKVSMLTDLEYRVWTQYLLTADDFGIMRASALTLQAANDHLANRPAKTLTRCIESLVKAELLHAFEHQGRRYVYQRTWQDWQKVTWPAKTIQPLPPDQEVLLCSEETQVLFSVHPGAKRVPTKKDRSTSEVLSSTREWLTDNGKRLKANGSEGGAGETAAPMDVWLTELQGMYPQHRVTRNHRTEQAFVGAIMGRKESPAATFLLMKANLVLNISSHEWNVRGVIPSLENYLAKGTWLNVFPQEAPAAERMSKSTSITAQAMADALRDVS